MSATLTWYHSGLGTKTGTTNAALIDDLVTLINSKSGDANFKWQVASSQNTNPFYIVLKRKDGSAGRILLVIWSSSPAGNNSAILDAAPALNALYGAYFPNGNVDTPSNLTASSGTILGNDSNAVKVWASMLVGNIYAANLQPFYFDSAEAVVFGFQNPASTTAYMGGAGELLVDASDNAYGATFALGSGAPTFGGSSPTIPWSSSSVSASSGTACVRTNYGAANRTYFTAYAPSGAWGTQAIGSTDVLTDTANARAYFVPIQLLGQTKGEGFPLKLRQIAIGPSTTAAFTPYNTSGPVVQARQFYAGTTGTTAGYPWFVNFKL
ncbi:MAG: hypothetical protein JSR30_13100 [Proteobacteria bacterium]|jgi:hypothetical protein|nr:hypothetical protein [Pseudomonadota bacterium]